MQKMDKSRLNTPNAENTPFERPEEKAYKTTKKQNKKKKKFLLWEEGSIECAAMRRHAFIHTTSTPNSAFFKFWL